MSLLARGTTLTARTLPGVRAYAVSRANPRPRDPVLNSPHAKVQQISPDVTFIHNPPSSVPTPHSLTTAPASPLLSKRTANTNIDTSLLPPEIRPKATSAGPKLTQPQIEEMRKLRLQDPKTNSCQVLARKYGCSPVFVSMVAPLPADQRKELEKDQNAIRGQWGDRKQLIREIRKRRREFW
ncbi:hypothetical protein BDV93DRAFT_539951 [Ceratobasidium sp. AG-I]|nr:hypothetical protein BDV93DRAFT_539951 [Ceratobasidium sp. AG-I]